MTQQIKFENYYNRRVIEVSFPSGFQLNSNAELDYLKKEWTKNLKSWHSPYSCLFNCNHFVISENMEESFEKLLAFFNKFFMKKIIGFLDESSRNFPFPIFNDYEKARQEVGLEKKAEFSRDLQTLRSKIQIDNDFTAHVMEIQFISDVEFNTKEDLDILKDKIKNILRQWHSPYSIIINCSNCSFSKDIFEDFLKLEKFLKSFFCKIIVGYLPKLPKETYPFAVYRVRHQAAAELKNNGLISGEVANCSTRK